VAAMITNVQSQFCATCSHNERGVRIPVLREPRPAYLFRGRQAIPHVESHALLSSET
jgi:hypothetical protein